MTGIAEVRGGKFLCGPRDLFNMWWCGWGAEAIEGINIYNSLPVLPRTVTCPTDGIYFLNVTNTGVSAQVTITGADPGRVLGTLHPLLTSHNIQ